MEVVVSKSKNVRKKYLSPYCESGTFITNTQYETCGGTRTYFNCKKCDKRTTYGARGNDYGEDQLVIFTCKKCNIHYALCGVCHSKSKKKQKLMVLKYISIDTYSSSVNDRLVRLPNDKRIIFEDDDTYKFIKDDYGDNQIECFKPVYQFDEWRLGPLSGPDGGQESTWYCETCDEDYSFNDK
jgi:hypothetical protein